MIQTLPHDVLEHLCLFLLNDGASLSRLSLCSQSLYRHIAIENSKLWKNALRYRWSTHSHNDEDEENNDPRRFYIRRHAMDRQAKEILEHLTTDLKRSLRVPADAERIDGNHHVGQAWDHLMWKVLLTLRGNVADFLQHQARITVVGKGVFSLDQRLKSFLAARALQTIQFAECLYDWKRIQESSQTHAEQNNGRIDSAFNALLLERYALLVDEIQLTPDQLIFHSDPTVKGSIVRRLDHLAGVCNERICADEASLNRSMTILEKIRVINDLLFCQEEYKGNTDDYYNYRNSLLDCVLETKRGIPITLAILYSCICRRLNLHVHLVGLPGHVVLGFKTDQIVAETQVQYLDVFHQGTILTVEDCQRICASYNVTWDQQHLQPLPAQHVLQRILNNLANCHFHGLATGNEPFHSDLFFHQRALASIHRQPQGIAGPLVDRVTQELPLTLSPDLLRFYGLISPLQPPQPPDNTEIDVGT